MIILLYSKALGFITNTRAFLITHAMLTEFFKFISIFVKTQSPTFVKHLLSINGGSGRNRTDEQGQRRLNITPHVP